MVMGCEVEVKVEYVKVEYVPAAGGMWDLGCRTRG